MGCFILHFNRNIRKYGGNYSLPPFFQDKNNLQQPLIFISHCSPHLSTASPVGELCCCSSMECCTARVYDDALKPTGQIFYFINKVLLKPSSTIHSYIVYGCLHATVAELSSHDRLSGSQSLKYLLFGSL